MIPKPRCAHNENSGEFEQNIEISFSALYSANGQNTYFPDPTPLRVVVQERDPEEEGPEELADFKEKEPAKYERWRRCREKMNDLAPVPPPCDEVESEEGQSGNEGVC